MDPITLLLAKGIAEATEAVEAHIQIARKALTEICSAQIQLSADARNLRSLLEAEKRRRSSQKGKRPVPKRPRDMARRLPAVSRLDTPKSKGSHGEGVSRKSTPKTNSPGLMPTGK